MSRIIMYPVFIMLLLILIGFSVYLGYAYGYNSSNERFSLLKEDACDIYNAFNNTYEKKSLVTGLYWQDTDFYCVWARDRGFTEIENTDRHEHAHYLIDGDYIHFCVEDNIHFNKT